ncbi:MAG: precorrin-8X methylmutase [Candidatus Competibacteraceae bacterium]
MMAEWPARLAGNIVAIGNALTALFRLLDLLTRAMRLSGAHHRDAVVGFINAAESKQH